MSGPRDDTWVIQTSAGTRSHSSASPTSFELLHPEGEDIHFDSNNVLYMYIHSIFVQFLYIGKNDRKNVRYFFTESYFCYL